MFQFQLHSRPGWRTWFAAIVFLALALAVALGLAIFAIGILIVLLPALAVAALALYLMPRPKVRHAQGTRQPDVLEGRYEVVHKRDTGEDRR